MTQQWTPKFALAGSCLYSSRPAVAAAAFAKDAEQ